MHKKRILSIALVMMMLMSSISGWALTEEVTQIPVQENVINSDEEEALPETAQDETLQEDYWVAPELGSINDNPTSGTVGKISWNLSSGGMLTISGTGSMSDFAESSAPWAPQKQYIRFIYVSDGITSIGKYAFNDLSEAKSAYIPDSVKYIGTGAFQKCSSLKEIALPGDLRNIGEYAFSYCSSVKDVTIPKSVTYIGSMAFSGCDKLKEINVNKNNKTYMSKDGVLFNKSGTTLIYYPDKKNDNEYVIPEGVTAIADYAFDACEQLESVIMPSTLKTIGKGAFSDCDAIEAINIPASVIDIAQDAFLYGMDSLAEINVDENNSLYSSELGVLFDKDKTRLIRYPVACEKAHTWGEYVLPATVKVIGQEAFLDCNVITNLGIHGVLEEIEMAAFMYFDSLEQIAFFGTERNWELVEKDIFNEKLDEIAYWFMAAKPEDEVFNAQAGVTYYLDDFVNVEGYEELLETLVVSSDNTDVAIVDAKSRTMSAISEGEATITAVVYDPVKGAMSAAVKVLVSADLEAGKEATFSLEQGETMDLTKALSVPEEVLNMLTWGTSNANVIKVENGLVTAVGPGNAFVTATVGEDNKNHSANSIRCEFNVVPKYTDEKYFKFSNGTITGYTGPDEEVIIPPTIGGVAVTAIGEKAFYNCNYVTKIELPKSVTYIGKEAFSGCSVLRNISLHEGITYIGNRAFADCISLVKITLPSTLTNGSSYSKSALFTGCTRLNTVEFAKGTKTIYPFLNGSPVKNVVIPSGVTEIDEYAFRDCTNLDNVTLPDSVVTIDQFAFESCTNLKTIKLGKNIYNIGNEAFGQCYKLSSVTLPASLTNLGRRVFSNCKALTEITIPDNVTEIDYSTFVCCSSLKTVILGNGVKHIDTHAFYSCASLETINLPNGLKTIGNYAFYNSALKDIKIPDTVTSIGTYAFYSNDNLKTVTLSANITKIPEYAFAESGITSITIPDNVTIIDKNAFADCTSLTSATIGKKVSVIGENAFKNCKNLNAVNIPNGVKEIKSYAFSYTGLTSVTIPDTVTILGTNVFYGSNKLTDVTLGKGFESISSNLFAGCSSIKNVTLADGIKTISSNAFKGCKNLEKIVIPSSVTSIGSYAFDSCSNLKEVNLSNNLKTIGSYAFYYCSALESITIPDSVTTIGTHSFYRCTNLKDVKLGKGITSIPSYTFYYCRALEGIEFPDNIKTIGSYSFYYCSSLESITIPANVNNVYNYAFAYCKNLSEVQIENTSCIFGNNVFYGCDKLNNTDNWTASYKALSEEFVGYFPMQIEYNIEENTFITNRKITVNLPLNATLVSGSMELDGELCTNYTESSNSASSNTITIPVENNNGVLTFCIKPSEYGTMSTTASMSITSLGRTITKQIGQVYLEMPDVTINAVETTGKTEVILEGLAIPRKNINLYIDDVLVKTIRISSSGKYKTSVSIKNPVDYHDYKITAEIINNNNEKVTADTMVKYIGNTPDLESLVMYYGYQGNKKTPYELYNTNVSRTFSWVGSSYYTYTFVVDISKRETVDKVYVISTRNGQKEYLEAVWNEKLQKYETSGYFANSYSYIPGTISVEYTKVNSNEKLNLADVTTYLDFEPESFIPSITDYTSETFSSTVEVSEALKDIFGDQINVSSEIIDVDYSMISYEELYPDLFDYYSYPLTYNGNEYVISFDRTDASNVLIYVHNLTKGKQITYAISFSNIVDESMTDNLIISDILARINKYAGNILDVYNLNVDIEKLSDAARMLGLDQAEIDVALTKAEELSIKKQMFVLSSIVLSASSVEGVSAPVEILEHIMNLMNQDIEYFKELKLFNIFKIGSECKLKWVIDPSGFVYEGVTDNRLEGVTATIYHIAEEDIPKKADGSYDLDNIDMSKVSVWDAEEYNQQNPLITSADGTYNWDVPMGYYWRVEYKKDGYETAYSHWMPVPPIQENINIGLVSTAIPKVEKVTLTSEYATIIFDQYIKPSTITNVKIGDAKYDVEYDETQKDLDGNVLAKEYKFKFKEELPFSTDYTVSISGVESYANVEVESYSQTHKTPDSPLPNELFLTSSVDSDTVNVEYFNNLNPLSETETGASFNVICTVYDENGALLDLEILPVENVKKGVTVKKAFTFISPFTDYKVFTWSSEFADLEPILNSFDSRESVQ